MASSSLPSGPVGAGRGGGPWRRTPRREPVAPPGPGQAQHVPAGGIDGQVRLPGSAVRKAAVGARAFV